MTGTVQTELKTLLIVGSRETDSFSSGIPERFRGWSVVSAETGEAGMKALNENSVRLIMSANKLPDMEGISFLKEAGNIQPGIICCLINGDGGPEGMAKAFNEGISLFYEGWDSI